MLLCDKKAISVANTRDERILLKERIACKLTLN